MGIDANALRFLFWVRKRGAVFRRCATLGRQVMSVSPEELRQVLTDFFPEPSDVFGKLESSLGGDCEPLMRLLGAEEIFSIDSSVAERPTLLHDLNTPVSSQLHQRFDVVIDGGTLEHVFNFPQAIKNCMEMLALEGSFLSVSPANNFCGHGFYQFSPELFFDVFSESNGFKTENAILCSVEAASEWYGLKAPDAGYDPIEFINSIRTYLLFRARRTAITSVFESFPQQRERITETSGQPYFIESKT